MPRFYAARIPNERTAGGDCNAPLDAAAALPRPPPLALHGGPERAEAAPPSPGAAFSIRGCPMRSSMSG